MEPGSLLYLSRHDVETIDLPMPEIINQHQPGPGRRGHGDGDPDLSAGARERHRSRAAPMKEIRLPRALYRRLQIRECEVML